MASDPKALAERARRVQQAVIEGALDRGLVGIDDPLERALYKLVCRYAGAVKLGDLDAAADAMEAALSAVRTLTADPGAGERMRERAKLICLDYSDACLERCADHVGERDRPKAEEAIGWAKAATACARMIAALQPEEHGR